MDLAAIRAALDSGVEWVRTGRVIGSEEGRLGRLWLVELLPDGREVQCELACMGAGDGRGVYLAPAAGDEIVVVMPRGDPNRALAIGALNAVRTAPAPASWSGEDVLVLHPGGTRVQRQAVASVEAVLLADRFQPDLAAVLDALEVFAGAMAAASVGALAPLAAPATALQAALQAAAIGPRLVAAAYSSAALQAE
jgi:hypothetical protein